MEANIEKIILEFKKELIDFTGNLEKQDNAYSFESNFNKIINRYKNKFFQACMGKIPVDRNKRLKIMTSNGEIIVPKHHPMSQCPMGFGISPYLQEQVCRVGSKLVFSEAEEEFDKLLGLSINAKQVERVCHCYGEKLEDIDWEMAYQDSVQLKLRLKDNEPLYSMIDGSMIFTREEAWKEIKLGRIFASNDQIGISKGRGEITQSLYSAHLGPAEEFWEKFAEIIPTGCKLVFISDGAKWIWNYINDHYPGSIQILDYYHFRQHLYDFAKIWFEREDLMTTFTDKMTSYLFENMTGKFFAELEQMTHQSKEKQGAKFKLLQYLETNKNRINYGEYVSMGLLIGSGPIESAHRNIIQKRLKLSGQRWTIKGAQQISNLRVAYKSNQSDKICKLINNQKNAA